MPISLLSTKLYIPPLRSTLAQRHRLLNQLDAGQRGKLTLVSAPAGFGKTTLVSVWLHARKIRAGWISLDENDNDPIRFLSYFVAALQAVDNRIKGTGLEGIKAIQNESESVELESFLIRLINEIAEIPHDFALVLDDYHVISNAAIQNMLTFCLEHQPPQMHLILTTRADPPWALAHFRVRQEIQELRIKDLRFTSDEATHFFAEIGLALEPDNIVALVRRTEGWAAGLQLAALTMQGREDTSRFVHDLRGDNRFIVDYLAEEVLEQQSPDLQDFMLKTSILGRMNASLCDALLQSKGSQRILRQLEEANLFLLPLDDERNWYRYHRLFADLLRSRLYEAHSAKSLADLHRRVSEWFAEEGLIIEAMEHALEAEDYEQVTHLVEGNAFEMLEVGELNTLAGWLEAVPKKWVTREPWMTVISAWVLAYTGQLDAVNPYLSHAKNALEKDAQRTASEKDHLLGHIAAIQTFLAKHGGEMALAAGYAESALRYLPEDDFRTRSFTAAMQGTILQWQGKLSDAAKAYAEAISAGEKAGDTHTAVHALCDLAGLELMLGKLRDAEATSRKALEIAQKNKIHGARGAEYAHARLSGVLIQKNELKDALRHAEIALQLAKERGQGDMLYFCYVTLSGVEYRIKGAKKALATLQNAKEMEKGASWHQQIIDQAEMGLHLAQGNIAPATRWVQQQDWAAEDKIPPEESSLYTFLTRVLIAQKQFDRALALLGQLIEIEKRNEANGLLIGLFILQATTLQSLEKTEQALDAIQNALNLGEPEGYVSVFIDEGKPAKDLLQKIAQKGLMADYVNKILEVMGNEYASAREDTFSRKKGNMLPESLSARAVDVLRLLNSNMHAPDIAKELFISVNTVRSHIKSLYRKLNVHSRHEAVSKAKELELL